MAIWIQHVEDMQDQRSAPIHKRSKLGADQILELAKTGLQAIYTSLW